jgi:hypothetical protein
MNAAARSVGRTNPVTFAIDTPRLYGSGAFDGRVFRPRLGDIRR